MATVIPIGEPANEAERRAIAHLRDHLPKSHLILHNFELEITDHFYEIDVAIITPHAVYLVDIKGTHGLIDVYGPKWYPEGRQPFTSPLLKLRGHARALKGLITASQPGRRELEDVYVDAAAVLIAPDATLVDPGGRDIDSVTTLKKSASFFQNTSRIPGRYSKAIAPFHKMIQTALTGAAKPRKGPMILGNWQVTERLGGPDAYTEYRVINVLAGERGGTVILRTYQADPYLPPEEREAQRTRIANAYLALNRLPSHPGIAGARDFFPTEYEDRIILVTEDVPGQALRLHIDKPALALTLDQKIRVARDLLEALAHCHRHDVVHRNLSPATVLLGTDGHVRLIGFDFARAGTDRSRTIADQIVDELDPLYAAPEAYREPADATAASDVFCAGLVLYELFTGERAFPGPTEVFDQSAVFSVSASKHRNDVPPALDPWLQSLCAFEPAERPSATRALATFEAALEAAAPVASDKATTLSAAELAQPGGEALDYRDLTRGTLLLHKFEVQECLGSGTFGVVYKVVDTFGDVTRVLKIITYDRYSILQRFKKEYRTLLHMPEHPHVVRVIDGNILPGGDRPYLVFEYVQGADVGDLIEKGRFAPEDVLDLLRQVAEGLAHIHSHGVAHCDIKPRNLLWTSQGAKIIDFNVAVHRDESGHGGGSRRYIPPDLDFSADPRDSERFDRDLYALGLTTYEALTGIYPWESSSPPPSDPAPDPRTHADCSGLSPELVAVTLKAIAPRRAERFESAPDLLAALDTVKSARRLASDSESSSAWLVPSLADTASVAPNTNPFVTHLLTLYSQSSKSNTGTRGLDAVGRETYVKTLLDERLLPATLDGKFRLVVITGNAGDGKTAFIEQLEKAAEDKWQASFDPPLSNGRRFRLQGRTYLTNYDGSQDEDDRDNTDVLRSFFEPFQGTDLVRWPTDEVRIIAINEGRLVDFLTREGDRFAALRQQIEAGLATGAEEHGVVVVNLNLRSVVVDPTGFNASIFENLLNALTAGKFWSPCQACDLKDKCYAFHNARTFHDKTAGPQVVERLKTLYTLTQLRGRLHITLRDLRSALAYMLVGVRDCAGIHELYKAGRREEIARGFYFNSWMGGGEPTNDRLLTLLQDLDVGRTPDPRLDRALDFVSPHLDRNLFRFAQRGDYDREVLSALFKELPRDYTGQPTAHRAVAHRRFVAMARRRSFFERRDEGWRTMLPYRSADRMLALLRSEAELAMALPDFVKAINRGEGLVEPSRLGGRLALRVRQVERGTIRSYRVFPEERFTLEVRDAPAQARFVEHMPDALVLKYRGDGTQAELLVNVDMFEMLERLNQGYRPSLEEEQGYYLSLVVFKNVLGSAPYQEVLLTTTGHDFYRIERHADGRLEMNELSSGEI